MRKIYKYEVDVGTYRELETPASANVVLFGDQGGKLFVWVLFDQEEATVTRSFTVYGTGWDIEKQNELHIASCQAGNYVWHLFESKE
jgi:hypothetical protein